MEGAGDAGRLEGGVHSDVGQGWGDGQAARGNDHVLRAQHVHGEVLAVSDQTLCITAAQGVLNEDLAAGSA